MKGKAWALTYSSERIQSIQKTQNMKALQPLKRLKFYTLQKQQIMACLKLDWSGPVDLRRFREATPREVIVWLLRAQQHSLPVQTWTDSLGDFWKSFP